MVAEGDVGVAFAFVIAAAASTGVGAMLVFVPKLRKAKWLAAGLGFAAGIMIYASLVEIIQKGVSHLGDSGMSDIESYRYATLMFAAGVVCAFGLDVLVHHFIERPARKQALAQRIAQAKTMPLDKVPSDIETATADDENGNDNEGHGAGPAGATQDEAAQSEDSELTMEMLDLIHEHLAVERMGILNAIALAAHNFPEGLATFVSALADPIMGGAVAIALILHNVPEGLSVAVPVSQATGSKWAGFWWGASTGISELLGGLFGYLILANNMNDRAMGLIFGLVAGIMVYIVICELIPTALRWDKDNKVVSASAVAGMFVMATSLVALSESGVASMGAHGGDD